MDSKVWWKTVILASSIVSFFVIFSFFGDQKGGIDFWKRNNRKKKRKKYQHNVKTAQQINNKLNTSTQTTDKAKSGVPPNNSEGEQTENVNYNYNNYVNTTNNLNYTDNNSTEINNNNNDHVQRVRIADTSNPYWTGEYELNGDNNNSNTSYTNSSSSSSPQRSQHLSPFSPLGMNDLDPLYQSHFQQYSTLMRRSDPSSLEEAGILCCELRKALTNAQTDLDEQISCTKAERASRLQLERKLDAEIGIRKRSDEYLATTSSSVNQLITLYNKLVTRQQEAFVLLSNLEIQMATLLGKWQLDENPGAEVLNVCVHTEEIVSLEKLFKQIKTQHEDMERVSEDERIEFAGITRRSKEFSNFFPADSNHANHHLDVSKNFLNKRNILK